MDMGHAQTNGKLDPQVLAKPTRRQHSADFKRKILDTAATLQAGGGNIGAMLRKEGLYWSQLARWRREAQKGTSALTGRKGRKPTSSTTRKSELRTQTRRVATLERELKQAHAIIEIQKKVAGLLAMVEVESDERSS